MENENVKKRIKQESRLRVFWNKHKNKFQIALGIATGIAIGTSIGTFIYKGEVPAGEQINQLLVATKEGAKVATKMVCLDEIPKTHVDVSSYVRRVAPGKNVSAAKKAEARINGIRLSEGYTFVRGYSYSKRSQYNKTN